MRLEHQSLRSRPRFVRRRCEHVLAVRDVQDVEAYVVGTIAETSLPVDDGELDELVRCGIRSVYRVERALPPERPLAPVLETALQEHLVDRWHSLHAERGDVATAAIA